MRGPKSLYCGKCRDITTSLVLPTCRGCVRCTVCERCNFERHAMDDCVDIIYINRTTDYMFHVLDQVLPT
jgi:hypothetical protein